METSTLKEIEGGLPKKNNAKYIRALDDDGNPIYISKEDLASVVGELLPEFSESKSKGLSTLTNGGRITKTITGSTGEKKYLY